MVNIDKIRNLFPVTLNRIYLDHASDGPLSGPASEEMMKLLRICAKEAKPRASESLEAVEETRRLVAGLLKVSPSEIAFVKNTSQGILLAIASIPWKSGDNVVLLKDAFPANIYPWLNLIPDVEKRWVEPDKDSMDELFNRIDEHTRAVSIDWVHYLTGRRFNLKELGELCRRKEIFLIVDAIQGLGALKLDLSEVKCDFLCAGASKWLFGPQGIGILYVSKDRFDELIPTNIGWLSAQWENFEEFNFMRPLKSGAPRLEEGTKNLIGIYGFRENLKIILDVGLEEIEKRIITLTDGFAGRFLELGCEILTPLDLPRSGILTFKHPKISSRELWNSLSAKDVVCSLRSGWIRLSPHFYNTEEEVKLTVDLIAEQARI